MDPCKREIGTVPPQEQPGKPSVDRVTAISDRFALYPVRDERCPEDIIGYDEFGVPQSS
jgi:hypothetical protein